MLPLTVQTASVSFAVRNTQVPAFNPNQKLIHITDLMKVFRLSLLSLLFAFSSSLFSQGIPVPATNDTDAVETTDMSIDDLTMKDKEMDKKKDKKVKSNTGGSMLEFGIRPAYTFVAGDVTPEAGFGAGIHLRKALDHLFSLRLDGLYATNNGMNENMTRQFESTWLSATGSVVVTLNNFRFSGETRKVNLYALVGAGGHMISGERQGLDRPWGTRNDALEEDLSVHASAGAGITFRISPKFNIGAEFQTFVPFGKRADALDGYTENAGNFRDIQNVGALSLNFNLGNAATKSEPLYWTNAFTPVRDELDRMSSKVDDATKDSDGDGVVDAIDQEANTPAGVPVDTKGRVLDSDKDGVADYKDLEPFFPPRAGEQVDGNGVVINRNDKPITEDRVQEMIDASIARMKAGDQAGTTTVRTERGDIFLPMIYFPLGQSTVKYSDYGTLSSVARVLEGNPGMRMVIRGYTDRTGTSSNNEVLSYRRAQAIVDHLVNQHGISRSSLVLQYRGEDNAIVPLDKSYINRRVEFLSAEGGATDDPAPAGANNGRGGF
jgi:outer membrane protein OmpA-like peptidoglycan-associated protein